MIYHEESLSSGALDDRLEDVVFDAVADVIRDLYGIDLTEGERDAIYETGLSVTGLVAEARDRIMDLLDVCGYHYCRDYDGETMVPAADGTTPDGAGRYEVLLVRGQGLADRYDAYRYPKEPGVHDVISGGRTFGSLEEAVEWGKTGRAPGRGDER